LSLPNDAVLRNVQKQFSGQLREKAAGEILGFICNTGKALVKRKINRKEVVQTYEKSFVDPIVVSAI
jgi:hypothetical protein